jgi:6-phosphogluconolactonase
MSPKFQDIISQDNQSLWRIFSDHAALLDAALAIIRQCEQTSASTFSIVLAGGTTPLALYRRLAKASMDWQRWRVYFGDERCLPPDHPDRNSRQIREAWLDHVPIAPEQIFTPAAELGPVEAARRYAEALAGVGEFDLVLLGMGEDGHTASLFPGHDLGLQKDSADVLAVFDAPKPPPERISLSARRLSCARQVMYLVTGASKQDAVMRWRQGEALPAALISSTQGTTVLMDEAASWKFLHEAPIQGVP